MPCSALYALCFSGWRKSGLPAAVLLIPSQTASGCFAAVDDIVFFSACPRENGQLGLIHSRTTVLPLKSASETVWPSRFLSEKAGAGCPTATSAAAEQATPAIAAKA